MIQRCLKGKFGREVQICQGGSLADLDPSDQTFLLGNVVSYLVTNSIYKLFADVRFHHNSTFLNRGVQIRYDSGSSLE